MHFRNTGKTYIPISFWTSSLKSNAAATKFRHLAVCLSLLLLALTLLAGFLKLGFCHSPCLLLPPSLFAFCSCGLAHQPVNAAAGLAPTAAGCSYVRRGRRLRSGLCEFADADSERRAASGAGCSTTRWSGSRRKMHGCQRLTKSRMRLARRSTLSLSRSW